MFIDLFLLVMVCVQVWVLSRFWKLWKSQKALEKSMRETTLVDDLSFLANLSNRK